MDPRRVGSASVEPAVSKRLVRMRRMGVALAWVALLAAGGSGLAQAKPAAEAGGAASGAQAGKRDFRFEVVSIHPMEGFAHSYGPPIRSSPGRYTATNMSIRALASQAFGLKRRYQLEVQPGMPAALYSVSATYPEGATEADLPTMLQHVLEDRFGLVYHRETRRMDGYELVVAKSGPKLAKAAPRDPASSSGRSVEMKDGVAQFTKDAGSGVLFSGTNGTWRGRNETMTELTDGLSGYVDAPVWDATGLEGGYDFSFLFTVDPAYLQAHLIGSGAVAAQDSEPPSNPYLREALESSLGLKLQPAKNVPVEVIVLDSANKEPTEN